MNHAVDNSPSAIGFVAVLALKQEPGTAALQAGSPARPWAWMAG